MLVVHAAVGDQRQVGPQQLGAGVRGEERGEVVGAQLLLALDQHPDVARERPVDREQRLDRRERREDLALVVGDAARVEAAVAHLGLERRRGPELVRRRGLDVVVAVDEDGRRALGVEPLAVDDRVAARLEQADALEADPLEVAEEPPRSGVHVGGVLGRGADARDAQELAQLVDVPVGGRGRDSR